MLLRRWHLAIRDVPLDLVGIYGHLVFAWLFALLRSWSIEPSLILLFVWKMLA